MEMERTAFLEILNRVFAANGLVLSDESAARFYLLAEALRRENQKMNLTAITDQKEIALRHFCDCALLADTEILPAHAALADVGAGAGFPTLPLAILRPDLKITAIDSTEKRMTFVRQTAEQLGLKNVRVLAARAETLGQNGMYRERYDCVIARAVARMRVLCEWCLPLVKVEGRFAVMKGRAGEEEAREANNAVLLLGGKIGKIRSYVLTDPYAPAESEDAAQKRCMILVEKIKHTPPKYPRNNAQIMKKPL